MQAEHVWLPYLSHEGSVDDADNRLTVAHLGH